MSGVRERSGVFLIAQTKICSRVNICNKPVDDIVVTSSGGLVSKEN